MLTDKEREFCIRLKETNGAANCIGFNCDTNCPIERNRSESFCNFTTVYNTAIKLLNEDEKKRNNMSGTLTITKEKVLEAANKCSTAKEVLKTIFPEVFKDNKYFSFIDLETDQLNLICKQIGLPYGSIQTEATSSNPEYNKQNSFFLAKQDNLDWILYDNGGHYSLVPIKK
jgi:hypothetical protein